MPILTSVSSEELIENTTEDTISDISSNIINTNYRNAFTVLNNDNLVTSFIGKPNAIVRPIRRRDPSDGGGGVDRGLGIGGRGLGDYRLLVENVEAQIVDKNNDKPDYELGNFTKELDLKLRRLQRDKKGSSKNVI